MKRISFVAGKTNSCIFPFTLIIGPVTRSDGLPGAAMTFALFIWAITVCFWRKEK